MRKELNLLLSLLSIIIGLIVVFIDSDYSFIYFMFFILVAIMFFRHYIENGSSFDDKTIEIKNNIVEKNIFKGVSFKGEYELPSIDVLGKRVKYNSKDVGEIKLELENMLESLGINADIRSIDVQALSIRIVMCFKSVKDASKFLSVTKDNAVENYETIEVNNVVGEKNTVELICPNNEKNVCSLRNIINSRKNNRLELFIGEEDNGKAHIVDLFKHNSVMITGLNNDEIVNLMNDMIVSLIMKHDPSELGLLLINNGEMNFTEYNGLPHLLTPLVSNDDESLSLLKKVISEIDRRKSLSNDETLELQKIVLFIHDIDYMVYSDNDEYLDAIKYIIRYGGEVGIYLVCSSNYIDDDESDDLIVICDAVVAFRHNSDTWFNKYKDTCIDDCAFVYYKDMLDYDLIRIAPAFVNEEAISDVVDYWKNMV